MAERPKSVYEEEAELLSAVEMCNTGGHEALVYTAISYLMKGFRPQNSTRTAF